MKYCFRMPNGGSLPLHREGLNILGCLLVPLNSEYSTVHLSTIVADIQKDLDALTAFPSLHQRTKLALYYRNTHITYLQWAVPLACPSHSCLIWMSCSINSWPKC
jgi:hypothetical protein